MNDQPNRHGEVNEAKSFAAPGPNAAPTGPCSVRVRSSAADVRAPDAQLPGVITKLPDLSGPDSELNEFETISYGGFAMWEKPVWRGLALGGVVIVLLAAVWFFSGRGRNNSGGMTDSEGRWQTPVPQPDAPEAPRWNSNLASSPNSAQPGTGQQGPPGWNWSTPGHSTPFAQTETPTKSPLGFDLPPGNRWGDSAGMDVGSHPSGVPAQQSYAQAGTALPVPSYAPQGIPASAAQQTAWIDPASTWPSSSQPSQPSQSLQPSWANAASSNMPEPQPTAATQAPSSEGQPYTVQNPYYQAWQGTPGVAQQPGGSQNPSLPSAPSAGMSASVPTWGLASPQAATPAMPTTYPQSPYAQSNAPSYGYPAASPYASPAAEERLAFRGSQAGPASSATNYVPAYSPGLNYPQAPTWNTDATMNSAYPASPNGASGWGSPADSSVPGAAPGPQPQVVDPAVVRADYSRTGSPVAVGNPSSTNPPAPAYVPAQSGNSAPYYYPSTTGSAPAYPQTSTSTWNTYR
ncbi:MAG: hypothetical protein ACUVTW_02115 [Thermogutta sp.]